MTDRELLELAAKAAEYKVIGPAPKYIAQGCNDWALIIRNDRGGDSVFDAISDDGDALRLAVKLGMHNVEAFPVPSMHLINECGGDPYAATRRSIVHAAAEIGKAMP